MPERQAERLQEEGARLALLRLPSCTGNTRPASTTWPRLVGNRRRGHHSGGAAQAYQRLDGSEPQRSWFYKVTVNAVTTICGA